MYILAQDSTNSVRMELGIGVSNILRFGDREIGQTNFPYFLFNYYTTRLKITGGSGFNGGCGYNMSCIEFYAFAGIRRNLLNPKARFGVLVGSDIIYSFIRTKAPEINSRYTRIGLAGTIGIKQKLNEKITFALESDLAGSYLSSYHSTFGSGNGWSMKQFRTLNLSINYRFSR